MRERHPADPHDDSQHMDRKSDTDQRKLLPRLRSILPARLRARPEHADPASDEHATDRAAGAAAKELFQTLDALVASVPAARTSAVMDPDAAAEKLARTTAHRAALLSGSLALPPGPLGFLTLLPDLYLIWNLQRQMVADIFALYGRTAELTRGSVVYCLFRHLASHVARDVAVRATQRTLLSAASSTAMRTTSTALGKHLTRRIAGATASRWIPLAGAAAVGAYAYWDTLQVAKAAQRVLAGEVIPPALDAPAGMA